MIGFWSLYDISSNIHPYRCNRTFIFGILSSWHFISCIEIGNRFYKTVTNSETGIDKISVKFDEQSVVTEMDLLT